MMSTTCTAFAGTTLVASGALPEVARQAKLALDRDAWAQVLIFDDVTSEVIEVDFRGTPEEVERRPTEASAAVEASALPEEARRPGRPRLGVVAREITLLPRHWEWLATQPGGASVALRKLVEQARNANQGADRKRRAQESCYRFLSTMAGNEPGFEEATRALFAGNLARFEEMSRAWPSDVRDHARRLAAVACTESS
ncbi:MAG: DUF2239 family protein [Candidatus Solibacter sp.]